MKLKKVEISAFRIYDNPVDATFDLTTKTGEAASFVSLYAPNGFGKTSFYDAIEYGFTESVDRFYLRAEELEKLANVQTLDKFIRNTTSERNTYVKIFTDSPTVPEIDTQFYKHGNQRHDLNLDKNRRKDHPFQKVILSQEWISAFLTESDGETRYKKFMNTPELAEIDNYYNNLKHLLKALGKKREELGTQLAAFEAEIEQIGSENLLARVNGQVDVIQSYDNEMPLDRLTLFSTREEVLEFQSEIADRMISSNRAEYFKNRLALLNVARSGSGDLIGASQYFEMRVVLAALRKDLQQTQNLSARLTALSEQRNVLSSKSKTKGDETLKRETVIAALKSFDEFDRIRKQKETKIQEKVDLENELFQINNEIDDTKRQLIDDATLFASLSAQRESELLRKQRLPEIEREIARLRQIESLGDEAMVKYRAELETLNNQMRELEDAQNSASTLLAWIQEGLYPESFDEGSKHLQDIIVEVKDCQFQSDQLKVELSTIDEKIESDNQLSDSIAELVALGTRLIGQSRMSVCPLCEADHRSFDTLISKVTNNNALGESLRTLLAVKAELEKKISDYGLKLKSGLIELNLFYQQRLNEATSILETHRKQIDALSLKIETETEALLRIREQIAGLEALIRNLSVRDFEVILTGNIDELSKQITANVSQTESLNGKLRQQEGKAASCAERIKLIEQELKVLSGNAQAQFVEQCLFQSSSTKEDNKERLDDDLASFDARITALSNEIAEAERVIRIEETDLAKYNSASLDTEIGNLESRVQTMETQLTSYVNFLADNFDVEVEDLDLNSLIDSLTTIREEIIRAQDANKKLVEDYQKLNLYCERVWVFLKSENSKNNAEMTRQELAFLEQHVEPQLSNEYLSARKYLEEKVKNFFALDLINQIYGKIDPHPDFKSVEFRTSFSGENPRLDVFVKKMDDEQSLVPNLYFSTAQINILSLSIFLASALKQTEYQSIFIDDPIQSMDSINVLSTIDLLRSIALTKERQVILSTHDINFHNLLQKKIPSKLFGSKFLELKSFGKVGEPLET